MNFTRRLITLVAATLFATSLFAHQGHEHKILGTVKTLHENHLVVQKRDGSEKTVTITEASKFVRDGKPADRAALREGLRVAVEVNNEDQVLTITLARD